jgi:hypothetical protein
MNIPFRLILYAYQNLLKPTLEGSLPTDSASDMKSRGLFNLNLESEPDQIFVYLAGDCIIRREAAIFDCDYAKGTSMLILAA